MSPASFAPANDSGGGAVSATSIPVGIWYVYVWEVCLPGTKKIICLIPRRLNSCQLFGQPGRESQLCPYPWDTVCELLNALSLSFPVSKMLAIAVLT